ncbi:MAG: hypothetical protein ACRCUX_07545 [Beijerinckiaceae bacterium]
MADRQGNAGKFFSGTMIAAALVLAVIPAHQSALAQQPAKAVPAQKPGDFADGLQGGPDFWKISGLRSRSSIAMRHSPRNSAAALGRLREGAIVKNNGCRMAGDVRWCRVTRLDEQVSGWVQGRFLRESAAP